MKTPPRFFLDCDDDGHWYIVPHARRTEWYEWRDLPNDDERTWETLQWVTRIDAPSMITFTDPKEFDES